MYSVNEQLDMLRWLKGYLEYRIKVINQYISSKSFYETFGDMYDDCFQDDKDMIDIYKKEIDNIQKSINKIIIEEIQ